MPGSARFTGGRAFVDGALVPADVLVRDGVIAAVGEVPPAADVKDVDARGCVVSPGLIDTHTHAYWGAFRLGVRPDRTAAISGTTTWVDAGTSGAGAFGGLLTQVRDRSRVRIVPFINLSFMGLANAGLMTREVGELWDPSYADVRAILRANEEHPGEIKGVKVRASSNALADNAGSVLPQARFIADELDVPLMIHIGMSPPTIGEVLPYLTSGDLLTHCFHPHAGGRITDRDGRLHPAVRDALDRGVRLDVGHGVASMSHRVAEQCLDQGAMPDSLSSDLHTENIGWPLKSQLTVLELFLGLGVPIEAVLDRATRIPADILGRPDLGRIEVGAVGDLALLRLLDEPFSKQDSTGHSLTLPTRIECAGTYIAGELLAVEADAEPEFRASPWLTRFGAVAPENTEES